MSYSAAFFKIAAKDKEYHAFSDAGSGKVLGGGGDVALKVLVIVLTIVACCAICLCEYINMRNKRLG